MKTLLKKLSLEEKIGQLEQLPPFLFNKDLENEVAGPLSELKITEEHVFKAGSVLGVGSAKEMKEIQSNYLKKSKHGIPLVFMADIIHGYKTIFPVPLAQAASWNRKRIEQAARISALEAQTAGIHVTFSPMADLARDPRWGRVVEGFGEDPYLTGEFSKIMTKGYQGEDLSKVGYLAACVKHYAAYGAAEAGRDYNTVDMSKLQLHQNYLNGYKKAIEAGAQLIMTSFNIVEGIPATTNEYLLRKVLREDYQFKGVVISDFASLAETINHGTSANEFDAAVKGLNAGLDIEMATTIYFRYLKEAIMQGLVSEDILDEAVLNILNLKQNLGLFKDPYKGADEALEETLVLSKEHKQEALKLAEESIVLLKNDHHVLPLKKGKIALIGPYATSQSMIGPWSWHGKIEHVTPLQKALSKTKDLFFVHSGNAIDQYQEEDINQLKESDYIVMALGEDVKESGEAHSRSMIHLPGEQEALIHEIAKLNKPIVLVLLNGRPLVLSSIESQVDAIVEAFFPGTMAGEAIANILTGQVNPSAKLTMSFPRNVGQIPVYYNHLRTGRPYNKENKEYTSHFLDVDNTPLYSFGYGLSYTTFTYHSMKLNKEKMTKEETITASISITNSGSMAGYEIVQLYIKDHVASVARPYIELKNFDKIWLEAGETKTVHFDVSVRDLMYIGIDLKPRVDLGMFSIYIGSSSQALEEKEFELI